MTVTFQRPVNTHGVWSASQTVQRYLSTAGVFSPAAIMKVTTAQSGPAGLNALAGLTFDFSGAISAGEASIPRTAPFAGTLSAANSVAVAKVAPTAQAVFGILKNGVSIGTCTFTAGQTGGVFAFSVTTYAKGDYFECVPPIAGDATLYGAALTVLGS